MDKRALKVPNNENQSKKPLKRPPFFAGYGNVKQIQSRPVELPKVVFALKQQKQLPSERSTVIGPVKKSTVPLKLGNNLGFNNIENDKSNATQSHVKQKRPFNAKANAQKPLPKAVAQKPLLPKPAVTNVHGKVDPKKTQVGQKYIKKPVASTVVKSQHPQSAILEPSIWLSLTEWCTTNKKNVSDFFYFSSISKPTEEKTVIPTIKVLPVTPLEKHLNRLALYLQKDNFPPRLMFDYLTNLAETVTNVKEYSTFWAILADCKLKEDISNEHVFKILLDAYKAKAKPPGKLIESYQSFVAHLMKKLSTKVEMANEIEGVENVEIGSSRVIEAANCHGDQKELESVAATTGDVSQLLQEDTPKSNAVTLTPFRKSVIFADPVVEEFEENVLISVASDSFETMPVLEKVDEKDENSTEIVCDFSPLEFRTPDSGASVFLNANSSSKSTGQRRTDNFDPALMFQSSQRKYAVLSEKNKGTPGNYLTPVRRSTRIEQEQDVLPEMLQEKLKLYDSPFQLPDENIEVRRNSALRNSFGGVLVKRSSVDPDDEAQD